MVPKSNFPNLLYICQGSLPAEQGCSYYRFFLSIPEDIQPLQLGVLFSFLSPSARTLQSSRGRCRKITYSHDCDWRMFEFSPTLRNVFMSPLRICVGVHCTAMFDFYFIFCCSSQRCKCSFIASSFFASTSLQRGTWRELGGSEHMGFN